MAFQLAKQVWPITATLAAVLLLLSGSLTYAFVKIVALEARADALASSIASTSATLAGTTENLSQGISSLEARATGLGNSLATAQHELQNNVDAVRSQVGGVEQAVGSISGTVNTLEKLSKTDPELLQKYSKVFFLNEHYAPERVSEIENKYLYNESSPEVIHASVLPHLNALLAAANTGGRVLYIKSAYRGFDEQKSLKSAYSVTYGAGTANQFSADQGYSEHQLGTAVDFITSGLGGRLDGFDRTPAYQWMLANAHLYGFILSYPANNSFYVFEPWHWRYVGVKLATDLHTNGKNFYSMDQREIDAYLVSIFE